MDEPKNSPEKTSSLEEEVDYRDKYLRLLAEHDNFMKSVERRIEYERNLSKVKALGYILTIKDMLDTHLEKNEFIDMLKSEVNKILEVENIEKINVNENDIFDSFRHEVVGFIDTLDENLENRVAKVLKDGFVYNGVLVRPAYVMLYRKKGGG